MDEIGKRWKEAVEDYASKYIEMNQMKKQNAVLLEALKVTKVLLDTIYAEDTIISSGDLGQVYEKVEQAIAKVEGE